MFTADTVSCDAVPNTSAADTVNDWFAPCVDSVRSGGQLATPDGSVHTKWYVTGDFHHPAPFGSGVAVGSMTGPAASVTTR